MSFPKTGMVFFDSLLPARCPREDREPVMETRVQQKLSEISKNEKRTIHPKGGDETKAPNQMEQGPPSPQNSTKRAMFNGKSLKANYCLGIELRLCLGIAWQKLHECWTSRRQTRTTLQKESLQWASPQRPTTNYTLLSKSILQRLESKTHHTVLWPRL